MLIEIKLKIVEHAIFISFEELIEKGVYNKPQPTDNQESEEESVAE